MRVPRYVMILMILFVCIPILYGQESLMDDDTKSLLDSLDFRIEALEREIPRLEKARSYNLYFRKRELDYTLFLRHYHYFLFEEDLEHAQYLVNSRLKAVTTRGDNDAIAFYTEYKHDIARQIGNQQRRYQHLFEKEKNFKKEFERLIEGGDEYALVRAIRMTELAIKYAEERNLGNVLEYLHVYQQYAEALLFDLHSDYDLKLLTGNKRAYLKVFTPLVESDSIERIQEAAALNSACLSYTGQARSKIKPEFFLTQKKIVNSYLSDYNERQGIQENLAELGGQSIIARMDSLNRAGVYKWHDYIVVVGHFMPDSKFNNVKKGEAIIDADHTLVKYIRVNRLGNLNKSLDLGITYVIPFRMADPSSIFYYNPEVRQYQYMVCYTLVQNDEFTEKIRRLLPPLQFEEEISRQ